MRTVTVEGRSITYPDKLVFAFNPNVIIVSGSEMETFIITGIGKSYSDTRAEYNGKISIDLSRYMQMFVDKNIRSADVNVEVAGQILDFTVLWGAINIGEKFNASRTITWYRNFPFTLNMYIPEGGTTSWRYEDTKYSDKTFGTGLVEINPNLLFGSNKNVYLRMLGGELSGVFELTFDYTFLNIDDNSFILKLEANECSEGVYLRWIDRHGFVQYRLFGKGVISDKSSDEGEELETEYTNDYPFYGVKVYQGKTMERSVKLGAALCDKEEYDRLRTLNSSASVDLYVNGKWIPVRINGGTVKDEGSDLQDYECEMLLPDIISQSL